VRSTGIRSLAKLLRYSFWLMSARRRPSGVRTEISPRLTTFGPLPRGLVSSAARINLSSATLFFPCRYVTAATNSGPSWSTAFLWISRVPGLDALGSGEVAHAVIRRRPSIRGDNFNM